MLYVCIGAHVLPDDGLAPTRVEPRVQKSGGVRPPWPLLLKQDLASGKCLPSRS